MRDRRGLFVALSGVGCVAVLATMLVMHAWPLWTGRPVYLRVVPVDPRDLFRGDYVTLSYDIQRIVAYEGDTPPPPSKRETWDRGPDPAAVKWIGPPLQGDDNGKRVFTKDAVVYLQLKHEASDVPGVPERHVPVSVSSRMQEGVINLRGLMRYDFPSGSENIPARTLVTHFGIDALFVEQGKGRKIEEAIRSDKPVYALVYIADSGTARVADLVIDGQRVLDPR